MNNMIAQAFAQLSLGMRVALIVLGVGAICLLLESTASWLITWPAAWTLPITDWVGAGLSWCIDGLKPVARGFAELVRYPMDWTNAALNGIPWPIVIGLVTAIGWVLGGLPMAALGCLGLSFVLVSGYWFEGMNTLALVAVSVPLAMILGGGIGIFAHETPKVKSALEALLDFMQTVPTFAYLTPILLLFGFGPVVGLIASAIYAAPPMARNVLLGLERIEPEIREAAIMSGGTRIQQLFQVELPSAARQIAVGINQCLMAALSMVIIAAVIGGFNDIGWEVLLTMRKAQFGQSLLAGLVIVVFAVVIDRMSGALTTVRKQQDRRVFWGIVGMAVLLTAAFWGRLPNPSDLTWLTPLAEAVDQGLTHFTKANGTWLEAFKTNAMFYGLLPLRIGLDHAVLPFTWGFAWTPAMSIALFAAAACLGSVLAWRGHLVSGLGIMIGVGLIETGIAELPWPFVLAGVAGLGWVARGPHLAAWSVGLLLLILLSGLWERALLSLYLSGAAVLACALIGGTIGLASAVSPVIWRCVRPICDTLQTIPLFVFLIPVLMVFQIGEFSAFLAICAYAIVPMIRYTQHGLVNTPDEMIEAATSSGATKWQILLDIRMPYAAPTLLLGLNQTILYAFAMLVIAALIGTTGLGQSIYLALGQADIGLGISAGLAMAILALIADRLVQGFAAGHRAALGL